MIDKFSEIHLFGCFAGLQALNPIKFLLLLAVLHDPGPEEIAQIQHIIRQQDTQIGYVDFQSALLNLLEDLLRRLADVIPLCIVIDGLPRLAGELMLLLLLLLLLMMLWLLLLLLAKWHKCCC